MNQLTFLDHLIIKLDPFRLCQLEHRPNIMLIKSVYDKAYQKIFFGHHNQYRTINKLENKKRVERKVLDRISQNYLLGIRSH
jgi:hypothetical protein